MSSHPSSTLSTWRHDAARIVEELFAGTAPEHWDILLDLRQCLLEGTDWKAAMDVFLAARKSLESDHYLPFYRLRRLLSAGLKLDSEHPEILQSLSLLLQRKHSSLAAATKALCREIFEQGADLPSTGEIPLRIVERSNS